MADLDDMVRAQYLRNQIMQKLDYNKPFVGKLGDVMFAPTDVDNFPYNRYYRSVYNNPDADVYDRRAGYCVTNNKAYECPKPPQDTYTPDNCFSASAKTVYPCYPPYFYQYAEADARNAALNRQVINTSL
jgi:hypothetical protein